ncbi:glycosyltransferase family A protein [Flavobacterium succinicans]|uniref:Glycosyl transferase family 2 n=1 Tax=Flavobacterium succinicans TaxID=29536 RepID=A0A199XVD6_9FLAO|nr:glycosyltransferase family 2 protein [Flavobacterium succinicans]OAZ05407.1 glycosyl transferase family 2 [Flavobacterium succinicans]
MRIGFNPQKDKKQAPNDFFHQVVIPVYIPNQEGYFKDSFAILKLCLESLFKTIHSKTYVTIVNNGSDTIVVDYLDLLFKENKIQELIHIENIGKMNAVLKGLAGHAFELVTISDSDVFFLAGWQKETYQVFDSFPRAGSVSPCPNSRLIRYYTSNIIFETFFSKSLSFREVKNPEAMMCFAKSISDPNLFNESHLSKCLTIGNNDFFALIGGGHFVSTYRSIIFSKQDLSRIDYKLGGDSETEILDKPIAFQGYWRLSTADNYAFHMGNTLEDWMLKSVEDLKENNVTYDKVPLLTNIESNAFMNWFKIKIFSKILFRKSIWRLFLRYKGLTKEEAASY